MNIHGNYVFIFEFGRFSGKENSQHLTPDAQKSRHAGGKFIWELGEFQLVKHDWLASITASWGLPVALQDGLGVHLLHMAGMHGHHHQASQPILSHGCTHVTFDVPAGRTLLSCLARLIGEVAAMSASCLTLEKTSPSHTDNIARRSSGRMELYS